MEGRGFKAAINVATLEFIFFIKYRTAVNGNPPLIEFSSFLIKLEYHVNLSCLHLHHYEVPLSVVTEKVRTGRLDHAKRSAR